MATFIRKVGPDSSPQLSDGLRSDDLAAIIGEMVREDPSIRGPLLALADDLAALLS